MNRIYHIMVISLVVAQCVGCYQEPTLPLQREGTGSETTTDANPSATGSVVNEPGATLVELAPTVEANSIPSTTVGQSKMVAQETSFDFGTMGPYEKQSYTFTIRNEGDTTLEIREGQTSCKCTLGEVGDGKVAPGAEATVTLSWTTASGTELFAHEAEVLTNDPDQPIVAFRIEGQVLSTLSADPPEFTLAGVRPGESAECSVLVSSQVWERFDVDQISSSLEGLTWDVGPIEDDICDQLDLKSGHRITIHLPDNLPRGYFSHWLRMTVHPEGGESRLCEFPVHGKVLQRVSVYGHGIDSNGTIRLGKIQEGQGLKKYFTVKVRDIEPTLEVEELTTEPDFLHVSFEEHTQLNKPGFYRMLLEIPHDAPCVVCMGELGKLHVAFKNPRFEDLELEVEFAILSKDDF